MFPMSNSNVAPPVRPVWTPEDYQRTLADAIAADKEEFDADIAYLRGLSDAMFEHGSPAALARIAEKTLKP